MKEKLEDKLTCLLSKKGVAWLAAGLLYPLYKNREQICNAVSEFLSDKQLHDSAMVRRVKKAAFYHKWAYKISYQEYFLFGFDKLNAKGKRAYIGDRERVEITNRIVSDYTLTLFSNKFETYKVFRPYFHRDVVLIQGEKDRELFDDFVSKHRDLIIKPVDQSLGKGIYTAYLGSEEDSEKLFNTLSLEESVIIEERIHQCKTMSMLHPHSVNTVRILTVINRDGTPSLVDSFLKIGRAGKCVDNGGQGGILAAVDIEYGIVTSIGVTENLEEFIFHPDTGAAIVGFSLPEWDQAKMLAKELALVVPEQRLVGWDLAHTEDGWVMVEGNSCSMFVGWQLTRKTGWRPTAEKFLSEWMD